MPNKHLVILDTLSRTPLSVTENSEINENVDIGLGLLLLLIEFSQKKLNQVKEITSNDT